MWPFKTKENRAVSSSDPFLGEFLGARWQARADIEKASGHAVAHRCIQLVAEQLASVPLKVYRKTDDGGRVAASEHALYPVLQESFSPLLTAFEGREWMNVSALMYGNAYARIERNGRSQIVGLHPIPAPSVTVERLSSGRLRYKVALANGGTSVFTQDEILHVRYRTNDGVLGLSPIQIASAAFGLALAQQDQAGAAAENAFRPAGALIFPEKLGGANKDAAISKFKERFTGQLKANEVMVLDGGAKFETFQFSAKDSEFLESRKLSNLDICRVYGVPPSSVGITDNATYSNIGEESRALVTRVLAPWAKRMESVYNATLLSPEARKTHYIEHDLSGLLRGDLASRYAAYKIGREAGFLSVDEIRGFENMSKVPGGDTYMEPLNMARLGVSQNAQASEVQQ
ncbi:phage portal protein [Agrobacterium tumefaciens]|uniref:Phage portal protein n=1 Tax=Agrobacterium tumefaciens TaxID=358 RepID=A0AA44J739_AGRTU|nr:phage portal protein [Agrobacterium tumefaciens]NSL22619.1 phage portal protein [Agrobacterium tumefaciens]NTB84348.1 phage portal protein [Agrobacterium tumefaciens]NTC18033.1 phage portal protein [Agrobacterium tumefaciens]NTC27160.1 phage portal protein [Agrobacterium tumefaciens]NTC56994.1 phage portal protein [Agrobacterium tumefaciens]